MNGVLERMSKQHKLFAAVGVQLVIMLSVIVFKLLVLSNGTEVVLQLAPVDPRDPLRGDYVTFQFDSLSSVSYYNFDDTNINVGDEVYVPLSKSGKSWVVSSSTGVKKRLPASGSQVFIKGRITGLDYQYTSPTYPYDPDSSTYGWSAAEISYGIEQYFIPEGTGQNINWNTGPTHARVAVDDNGNAVLIGLLDGKGAWPPTK